jgi:hypothetical protein
MCALGREELAARLEAIQQGKCFICEKPLHRDYEKWHIDHIIPRAKGGKDDENNYALTHEHCNLNKLDADLRVARCMAKYEEIKKACGEEGPNRPNLGDFLKESGGAKFVVRLKEESETVSISLAEARRPTLSLPVFFDKLSGTKSFFIVLPVEFLFHDTRINPRAVGSRVRGLIEEFLSGHPQLHASLAWTQVSNGEGQVYIFDGQHKAVAQMLLGARALPVRVFLNPDLDMLLETNTRAGTVLRQVAFDKSVQRYLGSQIFWEKVEAYRQATRRDSDDLKFSEQDLVKFFRGEHREIKRYILDDIRTSVIHSPENKLKDFVEFGGKATEKPISYNTIEKTFFSFFIRKEPMPLPMDHKLEIGENPRQLEKDQLVKLMNIFTEEVFVGQYDFDRGTYRIEEALRKGEDVPDPHLRAVRLAREEILYNVLRYVRDSAKQFFLMQGGQLVDDEDLFQRPFPELLWEHVRKVIRNLNALPIWINKDVTISSAVFGGKQTYDFWKHIFDTGTTPGGLRVLAKPLSLSDLLL